MVWARETSILSGHAGVSKALLVSASDVSKHLVLWRLLLEYMNLIILRKFYGILHAFANSGYQAVLPGLGTRLGTRKPTMCSFASERKRRTETQSNRQRPEVSIVRVKV